MRNLFNLTILAENKPYVTNVPLAKRGKYIRWTDEPDDIGLHVEDAMQINKQQVILLTSEAGPILVTLVNGEWESISRMAKAFRAK